MYDHLGNPVQWVPTPPQTSPVTVPPPALQHAPQRKNPFTGSPPMQTFAGTNGVSPFAQRPSPSHAPPSDTMAAKNKGASSGGSTATSAEKQQQAEEIKAWNATVTRCDAMISSITALAQSGDTEAQEEILQPQAKLHMRANISHCRRILTSK